jgi:uncharacterized protein (TIGR03000 family)
MSRLAPGLGVLLLGLALLLLAPNPAQAQRRVTPVLPYNARPFVPGGYNRWPHTYGWYARHYPNIYGYNPYWYGPYYYGYGYTYPYAYGTTYAPTYTYSAYYPSTVSSNPYYNLYDWSTLSPPSNRAYVRVIVPEPGTGIRFAGQETTTKGTTRTFQSPDLEPGKEYVYTVKAAWTQNGQRVTEERKVDVRGGQVSTVDFTRPGAVFSND